MKADQLQQILVRNPGLPVLFVSDQINGDSFEFGTQEEVEAEASTLAKEGKDAEATTAGELLDRLDFEIYEDQNLNVKL